MVIFDNKLDLSQEQFEKTILTAVFYLKKKDMLEALSHELLLVNGKYYKVPKKELLECLMDEIEGSIELELIELK
jgi:hypothetical protein